LAALNCFKALESFVYNGIRLLYQSANSLSTSTLTEEELLFELVALLDVVAPVLLFEDALVLELEELFEFDGVEELEFEDVFPLVELDVDAFVESVEFEVPELELVLFVADALVVLFDPVVSFCVVALDAVVFVLVVEFAVCR
jgi:hypothetical protein